jgi:hypothetical protein
MKHSKRQIKFKKVSTDSNNNTQGNKKLASGNGTSMNGSFAVSNSPTTYISNTCANKFLTDLDIDPNTKKVRSCHLYVAINDGQVHFYNLKPLFSDQFMNLEFVPHQNTRLNYNPFRIIKENFQTMMSNVELKNLVVKSEITTQKFLDPPILQKIEFQAHKETLTTLQFIDIGEKL